MRKTAIIFLFIFAMSIMASSASAQLLSPCDPQFNVCEQASPGQGTNDPIFDREGGRLQQEIQRSNETFDRAMDIMKRYNQSRINVIRGF